MVSVGQKSLKFSKFATDRAGRVVSLVCWELDVCMESFKM